LQVLQCVAVHLTQGWSRHRRSMWVMSHIWMSHVPRINESCHTCEAVTWGWWRHPQCLYLQCVVAVCCCIAESAIFVLAVCCSVVLHCVARSWHTWSWYVPESTAFCHAYEWVSHVTCMNESCNAFEQVMSHTWMSHDTHMNDIVASTKRVRRVTHAMSRALHINKSCPTCEYGVGALLCQGSTTLLCHTY